MVCSEFDRIYYGARLGATKYGMDLGLDSAHGDQYPSILAVERLGFVARHLRARDGEEYGADRGHGEYCGTTGPVCRRGNRGDFWIPGSICSCVNGADTFDNPVVVDESTYPSQRSESKRVLVFPDK